MLIFNGGRIAIAFPFGQRTLFPPRTSANSRPNGDEATSSQIISLPQWGEVGGGFQTSLPWGGTEGGF